jgi:hypothetical protein
MEWYGYGPSNYMNPTQMGWYGYGPSNYMDPAQMGWYSYGPSNYMNPTTYAYKPLPSESHIRLMKLKYSNDSSALVCATLEAHMLVEEPIQYTTLSYSWATQNGDDSLCCAIFVDGKPLPITQNLHDGLVHIRQRWAQQQKLESHCRHDTTLLLWVDAICINQHDVAERNTQVAMMAKIYARSRAMVIWLGTSLKARTDECAFLVLSSLGGAPSDQFNSNSEAKRVQIEALLQKLDEKVSPLGLSLGGPLCQTPRKAWFDVLSAVLERRYFFRRWVVQERFHTTGKTILIQWGAFFLTEIQFHRAILAFRGILQHTLQHYQPSDPVSMRMDEIRRRESLVLNALRVLDPVGCTEVGGYSIGSFTVNGWDRVLTCLSLYGGLSCRDERDKIYAFVSIASDTAGILPDYRLNIVEVCLQFATTLVANGLLIAVLDQAAWQNGRPSKIRRHSDLPSWVPDFRHPLKTIIPFNALTVGSSLIDGRTLVLNVHVLDIPSDYVNLLEPSPSSMIKSKRARIRDSARYGDKLGILKAWNGITNQEIAYYLLLRQAGTFFTLVAIIDDIAFTDDMAVLKHYAGRPREETVAIR